MGLGTDAELDYMLEDAGDPVVFSRGASVIASTSCLFDRKQLIGQDGSGLSIIGRDLTLVIRNGTQGTTAINDVATIAGVAYRVRDLGESLADGTRIITIAGG